MFICGEDYNIVGASPNDRSRQRGKTHNHTWQPESELVHHNEPHTRSVNNVVPMIEREKGEKNTQSHTRQHESELVHHNAAHTRSVNNV